MNRHDRTTLYRRSEASRCGPEMAHVPVHRMPRVSSRVGGRADRRRKLRDRRSDPAQARHRARQRLDGGGFPDRRLAPRHVRGDATVRRGSSDAFGRRPILLFSSAALALDYVVMADASSLLWLCDGDRRKIFRQPIGRGRRGTSFPGDRVRACQHPYRRGSFDRVSARSEVRLIDGHFGCGTLGRISAGAGCCLVLAGLPVGVGLLGGPYDLFRPFNLLFGRNANSEAPYHPPARRRIHIERCNIPS